MHNTPVTIIHLIDIVIDFFGVTNHVINMVDGRLTNGRFGLDLFQGRTF